MDNIQSKAGQIHYKDPTKSDVNKLQEIKMELANLSETS